MAFSILSGEVQHCFHAHHQGKGNQPMVQIISASGRKSMAWKNGGGITEEIAISPPGNSMEKFDWRISMAHVTADNSFSAFPGTTRHLVVLEGVVMLNFSDRKVRLDPESAPLLFSGNTPVIANVLSGPVRDLNIMFRDGHYHVNVVRKPPGSDIVAPADTTILFALEAGVVRAGEDHFELLAYDALYFDKSFASPSCHSTGSLYAISIAAI